MPHVWSGFFSHFLHFFCISKCLPRKQSKRRPTMSLRLGGSRTTSKWAVLDCQTWENLHCSIYWRAKARQQRIIHSVQSSRMRLDVLYLTRDTWVVPMLVSKHPGLDLLANRLRTSCAIYGSLHRSTRRTYKWQILLVWSKELLKVKVLEMPSFRISRLSMGCSTLFGELPCK